MLNIDKGAAFKNPKRSHGNRISHRGPLWKSVFPDEKLDISWSNAVGGPDETPVFWDSNGGSAVSPIVLVALADRPNGANLKKIPIRGVSFELVREQPRLSSLLAGETDACWDWVLLRLKPAETGPCWDWSPLRLEPAETEARKSRETNRQQRTSRKRMLLCAPLSDTVGRFPRRSNTHSKHCQMVRL